MTAVYPKNGGGNLSIASLNISELPATVSVLGTDTTGNVGRITPGPGIQFVSNILDTTDNNVMTTPVVLTGSSDSFVWRGTTGGSSTGLITSTFTLPILSLSSTISDLSGTLTFSTTTIYTTGLGLAQGALTIDVIASVRISGGTIFVNGITPTATLITPSTTESLDNPVIVFSGNTIFFQMSRLLSIIILSFGTSTVATSKGTFVTNL